VLNALPSGLLQLRGGSAPGSGGSALAQSAASPNGYFDNLWSSIRNAVCADVAAQVGNDLHKPYPAPFKGTYSPHDLNCQTNASGYITANILHSWEDQFGFTITGTRFVLDYVVPGNAITFSLTTPFTCSHQTLTCSEDPQFTVVFGVSFVIDADSKGQSSLSLPPATASYGTIDIEDVMGGDTRQAINDAFKLFWKDVSSIDFSKDLEKAAAQIGQDVTTFYLDVAEIGLANILNGDLIDMVSGNLNLFSGSAGSAGFTAAQDFNSLYSDLETGSTVGFNQFAVSAEHDGSLVFGLTYPAPGKPGVYNKLAQINSQPSIILPFINVTSPQVKQGDKVQVVGNNFPDAYATLLIISWDRAVWTSTTQTELQWGPVGGQIADLTRTNLRSRPTS
jgi:hypothetical protein